MIPIQLTLRNFMSYGEGHPSLCLDGIHVACLSGPNGHGKSTLLDAMVWAVWGEPRGGARAGDDLIRHGANETAVEYEFEAAAVRYRILRRRTKHARTGTTELHFESWDGSEWRSLAGGSTQETQRMINQTLHMTHDTFVHASFIAQGRADAFMTLTPQQRKQVLGEILDLGQYDLLAEAAREERRRSDVESNRLDSLIQNVEHELAQREKHLERLHAAEAAEHQAKTLVALLDAERTKLLGQVNQLEVVERQASEKESELRRIEERCRSLDGQLRTLRERIQAAEGLVARGDEIEQQQQRYEELADAERAFAAHFDEWNAARDDLAEVESAVAREQTRIESQLTTAQQRVREIEAQQSTTAKLPEQISVLHDQLAQLEEGERELTTVRKQLDDATFALSSARGEGGRLKESLEETAQRRKLLGEHDTCPLCGQILGADGLSAAQQRLEHECETGQKRLDEVRTEYAKGQTVVKTLQTQVKTLEVALAGRPMAERRLGELEAQSKQVARDLIALEEARSLAESLATTLDTKDFAHEQRARITPLSERLSAIGYDLDRHRAVRSELDTLRAVPQQMQKLQLARATLETHETQRMGIEVQLQAAHEEAQAATDVLERLQAEYARLPVARKELADKEKELDEASRMHIALVRERGEAQQLVDWLDEQERTQRGLIAQRKAVLADVSAYAQLAEAFGRNGIQEMIIEKVLPEIEEAANELLTRLSEGRMRVTLQTQRQGRGGGTIATLDVIVGDELGERPYELFSGGEKFRINFAIRIALSRLLARRSGVPLQMLAIDEGFGSQDRQGCDRLVEAIKTVQDDFARVLVITHLDELKDAFPVLSLIHI